MTEFRINQFTGELDKVRSDDDIRDLMWVIPPVEDSYDPTSGLPSDPSDGDRYISEATANGWTQDYVYEWDAASEEWIEFEPEEGWMVWLLFDMVFWFFFSGGWAEVGSGTYVPYTGATDDVDLGSYDLTTTGVGTFGDNTVVEDVITINIPGYAFGDTGTLKLGGSDNGFGGAWATISAEQDGSPASIKFSGDNFYMSSSYPRFYLENTTDGYSPYFLGSGGGIGFVGGLNDPFFGFLNSSVGQGLFAYVNATNAQMILAPSDGVGNQIVFTNSANYTKDHDHDTTTDPTLFIHSDTNPDSNNTQWLSLSHDKTNGVIESGTGTISFADNDLTTTGDINATSFTNTSPDIDVEWGAGGAGHSSFQWVDSNRFSMRLVGQGTGSPARASSFLQMNAYPDPSNTIRQRFGITFTTASDKWLMYADNTGTGTVSAPLSIYTGSNTDQILLNTDGSVDINGDLTTTGNITANGGLWDGVGTFNIEATDGSAYFAAQALDIDSSGNLTTTGKLSAGSADIGDGTNEARFATDGELTLHGTARVYKNRWLNVEGLKAPGTKPAESVDWGITSAWEFTNGTDDTLVTSVNLPQDMDTSVAPEFKIGFASDTNSGDVVWQLEYLYLSPNEDTTASAQETLTTTQTISSTVDGLTIATITGMDLPSSTDQLLKVRIKRLGSDGDDTLADDCVLVGCGLKYVLNKLGIAT